MEFVSWDYEIPNIWKNIIHVQNNQPDNIYIHILYYIYNIYIQLYKITLYDIGNTIRKFQPESHWSFSNQLNPHPTHPMSPMGAFSPSRTAATLNSSAGSSRVEVVASMATKCVATPFTWGHGGGKC